MRAATCELGGDLKRSPRGQVPLSDQRFNMGEWMAEDSKPPRAAGETVRPKTTSLLGPEGQPVATVEMANPVAASPVLTPEGVTAAPAVEAKPRELPPPRPVELPRSPAATQQVVEAPLAATSLLQDAGREWMDFGESLMRRVADSMQSLWQARTIEDVVGVQVKFVGATMEDGVARSLRLQSASLERATHLLHNFAEAAAPSRRH